MSFQTGLSGLRAATADLNTTGNNIANASTTGFKQARTEFGDVYAANLSSAGSRVIGSGVTLLAVAQSFNQGTISLTRRPLDVAINGGGFFVLEDGGSRIYSRAGVFGIDKNGYLVSNTGANVVGYTADTSGNIDLGNETLLRVQAFNLPPNRTTEVELGFNLDATVASPDPSLFGDFDPTDQRTFNHATSLTVYDSEGMPHVATMYFRKDQPDPAIETGVNNDWFVWVSLDGTLVNDNPANLTLPPATDAQSGNTTNATIGNATIANQALYTSTYANEYSIQFTSPAQYNVIARNLVTGVTSTLASNVAYASGGNIAAIAATGGVNVAISNGAPPVAPVAGDTFVVRPAIPPDSNQRATAFRIQFNTDGSLSGTPPAGFVTNLVIDDWVPARQVQSVFDSNAEPDGPNTSASTPVFNGAIDAGFSDFAIDIAGSTQFGDDFNIGFLRQDGFGPGQLVGTEISDDGVLLARYTNGRSLTLGQILLADFQNQKGLTPIGNTSWAESFVSGQPIPGLAGSGAFGTLQSGALEESNVDLTEELVDLIVAQRNFQANAKTIETNNAITQTLINIRS